MVSSLVIGELGLFLGYEGPKILESSVYMLACVWGEGLDNAVVQVCIRRHFNLLYFRDSILLRDRKVRTLI